MTEAPCLGTAHVGNQVFPSGSDIISGQMMRPCPCLGRTGLKRSSEFPNITQLILIDGGQKVGVESLDLKTQGCSAPKSTSFVLYHEAHNDAVGLPMGD